MPSGHAFLLKFLSPALRLPSSLPQPPPSFPLPSSSPQTPGPPGAIRPRFARPPPGFAPPCADLTDSAMTMTKTRGAAKADARLAVKSKGAEKTLVSGSGGNAGKDPVNGSKGKAPKTIRDIMEEMLRGPNRKKVTVRDFVEEVRRQPGPDPNMPKRPQCPYFIFLDEFRENNGNISGFELSLAAQAKWSSLSKEGRATYAAKAMQQLHEFKKAMAVYNEGINDSQRLEIICKLSIGIVKGLDHLHTASQKPIIHGNLKTNNIMLDADFQPRISDFGLYLLLNAAAAQEMLETSAMQGYKAPELIKMRDATRESDIYSLGVIMLEMLAQKEVTNDKSPNARDIHLPASFKDLVLERKISEAFSSELIKQSKNSGKEDNLNAYFELATACCNPSPSLRPDTKKILKRLEDIAR